MFSVMTSISSVETPVDRRRFVFSSVFVAYWASCRTTTPSSSHSSFTSSIWIYICIFRCTFRLGIDISASSFFIVLFPVHVIYFLLLRVVLLRLRVAEEFLFISARRRAYHL